MILWQFATPFPDCVYQMVPFAGSRYCHKPPRSNHSTCSSPALRDTSSGEPMQQVAEVVINILRDEVVDCSKVRSLGEPQSKILRTYLSFSLSKTMIDQVFSDSRSVITLKQCDYLDLSKRKDEILKKVFSVALKMIYKEFLAKNKINQTLNPCKYIKRKDVNLKIFQHYYSRLPQTVHFKKVKESEHNLIFSIKEGVTEVWFETIIGLKSKATQENSPELQFLQKIMDILRSHDLVDFYRHKVESMVCKTFLIDKKATSGAHDERSADPFQSFSLVQDKLVRNSKKPKTALSICQFRQAIQVAIETLEKLIRKYGVQSRLH
jgi:hypothetical protein